MIKYLLTKLGLAGWENIWLRDSTQARFVAAIVRLIGIMGNQGNHMHAAKYSVCMGIQCQIISVKFKFSNICELLTYDTRKFDD